MTLLNRHHCELVVELVKKEIKIRYNNSILGYLWFVVVPLTQAIIFIVIFQVIFKVEIEQYAIFLVVGLFPWQWFSNSIISSSGAILKDVQLIKKMTINKELVVYSTILNDLIHFLVSLPIIFYLLLFFGHNLTIKLIVLLPVVIFTQLIFSLGLGLLVASVNVFFRDLGQALGILINILFYATPIIYAETMVPEKFRFLFFANPMAMFIINYRNLFLKGTVSWDYFLVTLFYSILIFLIGHWIFHRLEKRFAEVL